MELETDRRSKVRSGYAVGVTLLIVSAITFSTTGIFTKGVEAAAWAVIFWRGVFAATVTTAWVARRGTLRQEFLAMGRAGFAVGVIGAVGTAALIPAFKLTTVANVALIYASAPFIAALMAWVILKERVSRRTALGAAGSLAGVVIIVAGSLGDVNLTGDGLALLMTVVMATIMVIYRARPDTPSAGPSVLQSLFLVPLALIFGSPLQIDPVEIAILAVFGVMHAIASVTLAEGAKRVPSGQTALLGALETPLAPILAFLMLSEIPPTATLIGGAIVLVAVLLSIKSKATPVVELSDQGTRP
ncbi:DMT family transporter [uncultured Roseobacter sp.]|uniref:DMT family transporter n=1 Tax=uncultured Roseobacter sp. TaxID=114847 RepID=UPI002625CA29|nr:DMT family transporter [uncultured Roseobacter sp.]